MARKSKYQSEQQKSQTQVWNVAAYIRLSREDGDKEESDSVGNQRQLLSNYIDDSLDLVLEEFYVDDGYSGTNFNRPDFMRMMEDMKDKKINCILIKDLSRLGRNYAEVGRYIEQIFPFMGIRFIAINDRLDSVKNPRDMDTMLVPFKNLMNDEYCRDISKKVRSSLDMKRREGQFIGAFAPYGYQKDPNNKNHLIIDEEAAEVVRKIYRWFIDDGMSMLGIKKKLCDLGIPNPTQYKQGKGYNYVCAAKLRPDGAWNDHTVRRILTGEVYIGNLIQGVMRNQSYKVQVSRRVPEEEWIRVEGTHESIISKEDFEYVQKILTKDTRIAPKETQRTLFAGLVRCGDCGRAMNRRINKHSYGYYEYYICGGYKGMGAGYCSRHTIRIDKLGEAVLEAIRVQADLALDMNQILERLEKKEKFNLKANALEKSLTKKRVDLENVVHIKSGLYMDWKTGEITKEEYHHMKESFVIKEKDLRESIAQLENEIVESEKKHDESNEFIAHFKKYKKIEELDRKILDELVDTIYVYEEKRIKIVFKFRDEYKVAVEYLREQGEEVEQWDQPIEKVS